MPVTPVPPDNSIPLVVGYIYQLKTDMAGQYVQIYALDAKYVYATGIGNHQFAPAPIPRWRFDDLVASYIVELPPV